MEEPEDNELLVHHEVLEFAETAYFKKFVDWLDREAFSPLNVGNEVDIIQSAVRANTLREIRNTLVKQVERARAATMEGEE